MARTYDRTLRNAIQTDTGVRTAEGARVNASITRRGIRFVTKHKGRTVALFINWQDLFEHASAVHAKAKMHMQSGTDRFTVTGKGKRQLRNLSGDR